MLINSDNFKKCLSHFATGVSIVTTKSHDSDEIIGITISSFTSLSINPPLILFCVSKQYHSHQIFSKEQNFTVSILSEDQQEISKNFSKHTQDKWKNIKFFHSPKLNLPIIEGCITYIECEKYASYEGGDHTIFLGKILNFEICSEQKPLIHYRSKYYSLK